MTLHALSANQPALTAEQNRFIALARKSRLPTRKDAGYADAMRALHSAILGLCALIESYPYTVEQWMPPLTDVLAAHATDPPPISTTIRKCASEFKKVCAFLSCNGHALTLM
jgi:proteasome activator subunit 4